VITAVAKRVAELVVVMVLVSLATFLLSTLLPGDPVRTILGTRNLNAEDYTRVEHELGLDRPFLQRYGTWLGDAAQGEFGRSLAPPRGPVSETLSSSIPISVELALLASLIALIIAIPLAMLSAAMADRALDRAITGTSFVGLSIPEFLASLLLILVFVVNGKLLPRLGWVALTEDPVENLRHAILPALALALPLAAFFTQVLRNDLVSTLREDYILAARATGEAPWRILVQGALRPSLFSLLTVAGISIGYLIGGTAVIEAQFGLPGVGSRLVNAIGTNDVPTILAVVLVLSIAYVAINTAIDLLYRYLDPRIRHGAG
jgi:peptide/nickel transport system permease protein